MHPRQKKDWNSRSKRVRLVASRLWKVLDLGHLCKGLGIAIAEMKEGEEAIVSVAPECEVSIRNRFGTKSRLV